MDSDKFQCQTQLTRGYFPYSKAGDPSKLPFQELEEDSNPKQNHNEIWN